MLQMYFVCILYVCSSLIIIIIVVIIKVIKLESQESWKGATKTGKCKWEIAAGQLDSQTARQPGQPKPSLNILSYNILIVGFYHLLVLIMSLDNSQNAGT